MAIPISVPKVKVVIYDGSGGTGKNAIPVRDAPGWQGNDLGMAENGTFLFIFDWWRATPEAINKYFQDGWAMIETMNGDNLFRSESNENWVKESHVKVVDQPEANSNGVRSPLRSTPPAPIPESGEFELQLIKVKYTELGQIFTWRRVD